MSPILDLENLTPISLEDLDDNTNSDNQEIDNNTVNNISNNKNNSSLPTPNSSPSTLNSSLPTLNSTRKKRTIKEKDIDNNTQPKQDQMLLSIKDCETLSGISKVSIRKAIKEKEINYILEDGKYKISFKELLKWCYSSTRRKNVLNNQGIGQYVNEWKIGF